MSNCTSKDKHCDYNSFKRARYFHGMLMTDRDFREEQIYHNEKRKLMNRMLHGWGVVCGFDIQREAGKSVVTIKPGMALDCHGNEILVCDPVDIDLASLVYPAKMPPRGTVEYCQRQDAEQEPAVYYIGIRYNEVQTDPVPVYAPGGGCEEKVCEYSRIREGFCIEIFDHKPCQPVQRVVEEKSLLSRIVDKCEKGNDDGSRLQCQRDEVEAFANKFCQNPLPCPDCCPDEHFIILGSFAFEQGNQIITGPDLNSGRSYVPTIHLFRYLFSSLASGIDTFFKVVRDGSTDPLPDVNLIHTNPIEALCWLARVFIDDADIKSKEDALPKWFRKETAIKPQVDPEVAKLRKELDALKSEVQKLKKV